MNGRDDNHVKCFHFHATVDYSKRGASDEYLQHMFLCRKQKIVNILLKISLSGAMNTKCHCSLEIPKRVIDKQCIPRSDQGLHCLQIAQPFFSRNI